MAVAAEMRFRQALAELERAVDQLASPRYMRVDLRDGDVYTARKPCLWTEMAEHPMLQREPGVGARKAAAKSAPPLRLEVVDWLRDVQRHVTLWVAGPPSPERLREWVAKSRWRPEDAARLEVIADMVGEWIGEAERLLDARRTFGIRGRCPKCGTAQVRVRNDEGDRVWRNVLQATDLPSCSCLRCGANWAGLAQMQELSKVI
ncbi:hypothetical protein AB0E01_22745 [Nocardia vinacea]|uniref:DUF7341 domain-containing protein n=1 Tax=Nocardia vinacea TaxID=96468 RepID=UPI00340FDC59